MLHDGVFRAAGLLYGLSFAERHDLPRYHPDVRIFDVDDADGPLGLFVADFYARDSKRGGAWMNSLRLAVAAAGHQARGPQHPERRQAGRRRAHPADPRQVSTLFHEFGHALHGLFSDVRYPTFSGTAVPRDFVEYPSQVNEMWLDAPGDPDQLRPPPRDRRAAARELVERLAASRQLRGGLRHHRVPRRHAARPGVAPPRPRPEVRDVPALRGRTRSTAAGIDVPTAPPRYRSTYFNHVFGGGYSAGYYSYIWSEVLDADTVEWFAENGGLTRENGDTFRRELLAAGGAVDPMEAYRAFRGRDPEIGPLLVRRGLTPPDAG